MIADDILTKGTMILLHLSEYTRFKEDFVRPYEMTQQGIADKIGTSRPHVCIELKKLMKHEQVELKQAHVVKAKRIMNTYCLTQKGIVSVNWYKREMEEKKLVLEGNGGREGGEKDGHTETTLVT